MAQQMSARGRSRHHRFLRYTELGSALATIRDADIWWAVKSCLLFIAFTGVRSGEARGATWDEIDLANATWTIPASRMKNRTLHRVPLSTQAMQILAHARAHTDRSDNRIFPPQRGGKYIGSDRLSKLLKNLEILTVPHGFRSSFRSWAAELAHIKQPVADICLAHYPTGIFAKAPMNSDLFDERQTLMQEWADHLTETMGPVIPTTEE